jgi:hypothetical protein
MSQDNGELRAQSYVGFESKLRPDYLMCNARDYVLIACTWCSSYHSADRAQAAQTRFSIQRDGCRYATPSNPSFAYEDTY